jgi:hypothetical protein
VAESLRQIFIGTLLLLAIGGLIYGTYNLYRWFNWEFSYKNNVSEMIKETVKGDCLK